MSDPLLTSSRSDRDIVAARQSARQVSALLGFETQDQIRIATAVSELVRNAVRYAGGGSIEFAFDATADAMRTLEITIGIGPRHPQSRRVLSGTSRPVSRSSVSRPRGA